MNHIAIRSLNGDINEVRSQYSSGRRQRESCVAWLAPIMFEQRYLCPNPLLVDIAKLAYLYTTILHFHSPVLASLCYIA